MRRSKRRPRRRSPARKVIDVAVPSRQRASCSGWLLVPATHADALALEVMDLLLLGGTSGIITRDLLLPQKVADAGSNPTFLRARAAYYQSHRRCAQRLPVARRSREAAARRDREGQEGRLHRDRSRRDDRLSHEISHVQRHGRRVEQRSHAHDGGGVHPPARTGARPRARSSIACTRSRRRTSCASRTSTSRRTTSSCAR